VVRVRDFLRGKLGARGASLPPVAKAACSRSESGALVGICKTLQSDCTEHWETLPRDASGGLQIALWAPKTGMRWLQRAGRCLLSRAGGARETARRRLQRRWDLLLQMTYGHLKGPSPTKKGAMGLV
jgi:hypothetical protein